MRLVFELAWIVVTTTIAFVEVVERKRGGGEKGERFLFPFHFFSPLPLPLPLLFMGLPHRIYGYILKKYQAAFPLTPGWVVSPSLGMNKMITYGKMR